MNISNTLGSFFLLFITNEFFRRNYPDDYEIFMVTISYNAIILYSKTQLFFIKFFDKFENIYIQSICDFSKYSFGKAKAYLFNNNDIEVIKNGQLINSLSLEKLFTITENKKKLLDDFDFMIYSVNQEGIDKKKLIYDYPIRYSDVLFQECNFKFIMIEVDLLLLDRKYSIVLSNNKYNYMLVNNIIDSKFICYFLKKYYKNLDKFSDYILKNYTLKIIDDNVNITELTTHDKIKIYYSSYEIIVPVKTANPEDVFTQHEAVTSFDADSKEYVIMGSECIEETNDGCLIG